jgi:hypothetical protein
MKSDNAVVFCSTPPCVAVRDLCALVEGLHTSELARP